MAETTTRKWESEIHTGKLPRSAILVNSVSVFESTLKCADFFAGSRGVTIFRSLSSRGPGLSNLKSLTRRSFTFDINRDTLGLQGPPKRAKDCQEDESQSQLQC